MEAGAGVKVMAAAGASADGGTLAVAAVGKSVATGTDDKAREFIEPSAGSIVRVGPEVREFEGKSEGR